MPNLRPVALRLAPALVAAALLTPSTARADIPGPNDHLCTVENQQTATTTCESCAGNREAPNACADAHTDSGWTQACRTSGGTVWREIWCRPRPGTDATTTDTGDDRPRTSDASGCAAAPSPRGSSAAGALILAALVALRRRPHP